MKKPIQAGDLCRVISGMMGKDSPNIGLIVQVRHRVYECPKLGVIWRCEAEFAERAPNTNDRGLVPGALADFAADWLVKIEPPPLTTNTTTKEVLEVDA